MIIKKKKHFFFIKVLSPKKLRITITDLGTSFIKLAQVLATRADFFPAEYIQELKQLHDQIPPMKPKDFETVYALAFNESTLKTFDKTPIASATIGQVHRATTYDGQDVAVKVLRLGIKAKVTADIRIVSFFNTIFKPFFSFYTKNSINTVIREFSGMIQEEVDFTAELHNLQKFSTMYKDSGVKFPKAYPQYCSKHALVMSYEEGFRFDDKENILKHKIDFQKIIAKLVNFYMEQMLLNGYFHADPHPGNLLVTKDSELILLDFGMVKTVPNDIRIAIIELLKFANDQDFDGYVNALKRLGSIGYEAPSGELAEFTGKMFELFSNENITNESMQTLSIKIMEAIRKFPFKLPSDAIYIIRVSSIIEGLGTTYIHNFNGIKDILPLLLQNISKALGSRESMVENIVDEIEDIPFIYKDFKTMVKKASRGSLEVELSRSQLEWLMKEVKNTTKKYVIGFSLMITAFFIYMIEPSLEVVSIGLFVLGLLGIVLS